MQEVGVVLLNDVKMGLRLRQDGIHMMTSTPLQSLLVALASFLHVALASLDEGGGRHCCCWHHRNPPPKQQVKRRTCLSPI